MINFYSNVSNIIDRTGLGKSNFALAFLGVFKKSHLKIWLPCLFMVKTILFLTKEGPFTSFFLNLSFHMRSAFDPHLPPYFLIMCVSIFLLATVGLFLYLLYSGVLKSKITFFLNNKKSTVCTFLGKLTGKNLISLTVVYLILLFFGVDLTTEHISLFFSSLLHLVFTEILNGFVHIGWMETVLGVGNTNPNNSPTPNPRPDGPSNTPVLPQDRNNSRPEETNTSVTTDVRSIPVNPEALGNLAKLLSYHAQDAPRVSAGWFYKPELDLFLDHLYQIDRTIYDQVCNGPLAKDSHHAAPNFQLVRNTIKFRKQFKPR